MSLGRAAGVVLAGGRGSRLGEPKHLALLDGRPLAAHVAWAMAGAGLPVHLVGKDADAMDPARFGVPVGVLVEPAEPVHPLTGIAHALATLQAPIVACPCDMPDVPAGVFAWLAGLQGHDVVVFRVDGRVQPLVGRYSPAALPAIRAALADGAPARAPIAALGARAAVLDAPVLDVFGDPTRMFADIDTPRQLAAVRARHGVG